MMGNSDQLVCAYCGATAEELEEYDIVRAYEDYPANNPPKDGPHWTESRTDACRREEGTLNRRTGKFACTPCYLKIGQPSSPRGWTVPDEQ